MILGVGIDLVDIDRVERLVAAKGERALARLFTAQEVAYAMRRANPSEALAARLAAKEAAYKAFSACGDARAIGWRELEVVNGQDRRPSLIFHGRAQSCAAALGVARAWVTLTHSATTAGAVVVLEGS